MKKNKTVDSSKKLVLNKQTIRELRPVELQHPAGGTRNGDEFDNDDGGGGSGTCPC